jgi:hypothetical protein
MWTKLSPGWCNFEGKAVTRGVYFEAKTVTSTVRFEDNYLL